jgi:hypothetical protein
MKKLIGIVVLGLMSLSINPNEIQAQDVLPMENPCDAGENQSFERCRDKNCTEQLNIGCTFLYGSDLVTLWGRRES